MTKTLPLPLQVALICERLKLPHHGFFYELMENSQKRFFYTGVVSWSQVEESYQKDLEQGRTWIDPTHPWYPDSFRGIDYPPHVLRMEGRPCWQNNICLSVVGSRDVHRDYLLWMRLHLAPVVQEEGLVTISGGARGVDQEVHQISLQAGLPTVVLLPSGLDQIYPREVLNLRDKILRSGGALLSEYGSQVEMKKHFFQQRNRLISALGDALLIIQAGEKSGTGITAQYAADQGKSLYVLPAHPMDVASRGNLRLLGEGATMVRDRMDLKLFVDLHRTQHHYP
ncbi:MAG: DNA-processing protein DprA [Pseudobdellovibrionaceae bacterium]